MKKILLILIAMLMLTSCGKDLPDTPTMPGQATFGIGGAIAGVALPNWAAEPVNVDLQPTNTTYGDGIIVTVNNYDYIYKNAYLFNSQQKVWEKIQLDGELEENWVKNTGIATISVSEQKFKEGDNYIVVYGCNKIGDSWNCNGKKWMLMNFQVNAPVIPETTVENVDDYIINAQIPPLSIVSTQGEMDNFEDVIVTRYDAKYRDAKEGLIVLAHVFEFANDADMELTMSTLFKDIVNRGWKRYNGNNLALFLDEYDHRITIWTSGLKLLYIDTYQSKAANKEIIDSYLAKYPSDLVKR